VHERVGTPVVGRIIHCGDGHGVHGLVRRAVSPRPGGKPPGSEVRHGSHLWFEWNRPRAIEVTVSPTRAFSALGITYAEGVATADRVPPSRNYRVLLVSWWLLAGAPLVVFWLSYAGLARQRAPHAGREAAGVGGEEKGPPLISLQRKRGRH